MAATIFGAIGQDAANTLGAHVGQSWFWSGGEISSENGSGCFSLCLFLSWMASSTSNASCFKCRERLANNTGFCGSVV